LVTDAGEGSILPLQFADVRFEVRGQVLVAGISFRIEAGGPTVIMGPNGAGKSLTLRLAHGLLEASSGTVRWCGPTAGRGANPRALRRAQAMVFERSALLRRSAAANVDYALAVSGLPRSQRRQRTREVLEKTGLVALSGRPARVLSAGEQQRLALARAWALEPQVLFLDEPTAALDPSAVRAVEALILAISASGCKIVMTTHDLGQARRLASEVLVLHRGSILEHAPAERFFSEPESEEASRFLRGELLW
jgi:tungstate transport system ATP-binding protein